MQGPLRQRCKKGWSMGALLPEGNGLDHSWQKDWGKVYRTCCNFYKNGYSLYLCSWTIDSFFSEGYQRYLFFPEISLSK